MIYIIDNGMDYSCHTIYFVDTEAPTCQIETMIKVKGDSDTTWGEPMKIIGTASSMAPGQTCSLESWAADYPPIVMRDGAWVQEFE